MKKNIIISLLCISFLGNSCTSDFLDVQPQSSLTTAVFYTTENDFDQAIAAAYNQLQGIYVNGNQYQQIVEGRSDDETAFNYWVLEYGKFLDTDFSNGVSWVWSSFFKTIATTNAVITEIEGKDLANKERVLGEAHFIRGLCYMELAKFFGGVPLYDGRRSTEEYKTIPRSTLEETYNFIYADLNTAITNLPASYGGSDIGRATSGAAKGFLARAYLYNNDYTNCLATCNSITGYQFFTDWSQIFNEDNDNGPQALFQLQYTSGGIGEGSALQTNLMEANARVVNGRTMQYNGSSLVPVVSNDFIDSFEPGDSRFDLSLALTNEQINGSFQEWPMVWKFTAGAYDPSDRSDWGLNYSLMRYTEILLMKAECINELNGPTTEAINIINMIRTRANLPDLTPSDTSDDLNFFAAIVKERRHELFYEGHRWFDLVRWGMAQEVINAFLEDELPTEAAARMSEKHKLFPIPSQQIEIIGDESVLWQNPNW